MQRQTTNGVVWLQTHPTFTVLFLSLLVTLIHLRLLFLFPPFDGDAFEYASAARNLVREGAMLTSHVQGYFSGLPPLVRPAWDRANLLTIILAPSYLIFGDTYWTLYAPLLVALFFLPLLVFRFTRRWIGEGAAWFAAVAMMLHPRLIAYATSEDAATPDLWVLLLALPALDCFLQKKYLRSGLFAGGAFLFRLNHLATPFLLLAGLVLGKDRKELRNPRLWAGLAIAGLLFSLIFIRNALLFGNPFYSDQFTSPRGSGAKAVEQHRRDFILQHILSLETKPLDEDLNPAFSLTERLTFLRYNLPKVLRGVNSRVTSYPGLPAILFYLLAPFVLIGLYRQLGSTPGRILIIWLTGHLFFVAAILSAYEDRFYLLFFPFLFALAADGVLWTAERLSVRQFGPALLAVMLAGESFFALMNGLVRTPRPEEKQFQAEWAQTIAYLRENSPRDAVIMTFPLWSPHFLADRHTVPPPYGPLANLETVVRHYGVGYFLYGFPVDDFRFPALPFLHEIKGGRFVRLYAIDRDPAVLAAALEQPEWRDFNFLDAALPPGKYNDRTTAFFGEVAWRLAGYAGVLLWLFLVAGFSLALAYPQRSIRLPAAFAGAAVLIAVAIIGPYSVPPVLAAPGIILSLTLPLRRGKAWVHGLLAVAAFSLFFRMVYLASLGISAGN